MSLDLFDRFDVIDVDTHLTEPPDAWTARMPAVAARRRAPHRARRRARRLDGRRQAHRRARLLLDGRLRRRHAGRRSPRPTTTSPRRCTTRRPGSRFLDEEGITAQVLYPNVGGFGNGYFLSLGDRELVAAVRAGLQRLPHRLVQRRPGPARCRSPRCRSGTSTCRSRRSTAASSNGHRAVNFCNQPQDYGQPPLAHPHWDPIWASGAGGRRLGQLPRRRRLDGHAVRRHRRDGVDDQLRQGVVADLPRQHALHRRPDLRRRVPPVPRPEAGVGRVGRRLARRACSRPSTGSGATAACATSTPSTTCCRASTSGARSTAASGSRRRPRSTAIEQFPDNILYETDYPHPTCQHPGPRTPAQRPRDYADPRARRPRRRRAGQGAARQRRRGLRPRLSAPELDRGRPRPRLAEHRRRASTGGCCTCASTGSERRNAFTQDMYRAHQAGRDLGRRPGRARRRLPHRHRRVVRRRRRHVAAAPTTPRVSPPSGTRPTSSRSATSSAARSCGWPRSTGCATPAGSF